ncbi:c-type cytochrome biogenesis protein CcsB [Cellulomonas denverensis]|uniref:C-type cytochrome biogenesis protein CcsB n=1 Tax=Cellulomonas denverensis TaxID=264297 RepID=A0A7X6QY55_9CELL|nr:c-type cytochrome biogenesis protein CcsB [Cellulomonas denverensis]NKY21626.1 c-type cytochrome biogenesis protein CcsB [Cellulomonas denverensis]GIG25517.1 c-type cytochrome biogenesis protein CcsB [Cellulomonas denverensis]
MAIGDISTLFVWGAATAFTIALIAYAVALARVADAATAEHRAERARKVAAAKAEQSAVREAVGSGGLVVPVEDGGPAGEQPVTDVVGPSRAANGIARSTSWLGLLLLGVGIVLRGVAAGRWPTANMYEFTLVGTFVAAVVLVLVQRRRVIPFLGVVVMGIAVLALVLGLNAFYVQADEVQPALQNYWLVIHVGVAIAATGVFTVAFATSVLQLLQDGRENDRSHVAKNRGLARWRVTGPAWAWLRTVPSARQLEALSFRLNAIGFVLWTLTLIGGSIWAEQAWGRYWGWDPKEVGTFVAWVIYAAYLHARTTRGWAGRRAAYFVFVGYAVVLANFTVVNLFVTGKHSYSGI